MEHRANLLTERAVAYLSLAAPQPDVKVGNQAYALACAQFWPDIVRSGAKPRPGPETVSAQPVEGLLAARYLEMLA